MAHFSLLRYDYINKSIFNEQTGYYLNQPELNIGDIIQSIAARQFLPHVSDYIDRDGLVYAHEPTNIILNGWFRVYDGNSFIPENMNALVVSMYLRNNPEIPRSFLDSLKRFEPIGTRDIATKEFLRSKGINCYFSSCMTTTLSRTYKQTVDKRKGLILVDFVLKNAFKGSEEEDAKAISDYINTVLSAYKFDKINHYRHSYDARLNLKDQFAIADRLLCEYANAELVITTRLHCALPCLSFGTPVILVTSKFDVNRFSGLANFLNVVGFDPDHNFICEVALENGRVVNKDGWQSYARGLEKRCLEFVAAAQGA